MSENYQEQLDAIDRRLDEISDQKLALDGERKELIDKRAQLMLEQIAKAEWKSP